MRYRLFFENGISSFLKKDSVLLDRSSYFDQITVQIIKTDYLLFPQLCVMSRLTYWIDGYKFFPAFR